MLRRRSLRRLRSIASRLGIQVWVVGGALRDVLEGLPVPEVDVAVSQGCAELARALEESGCGTSVALSEDAPRVYRVAGRPVIDCADIEGGSIAKDLARRDFTVNAIAFDLATGSWIDPFDGISDLAARRLRAVAPENLRQDPLRALRAIRFAATHGLRPDGATLSAVEKVGPLLATVAAERIQVELAKMLGAPRVSGAFRMATRSRLLSPALGLRVPRNPKSTLPRSLDDSALVRLEPSQRLELRLALLAAALGLSPQEARRWLAERRFSRRDAGRVADLMALAEAARELATLRQEWAWIRDAGTLRPQALRLLLLLDPGQKTRARRLARRRSARRHFHVSGRDVLAWLPVSPGPQIGQLLADLEIEAMRGRVRSREAARRWLIDHFDGLPPRLRASDRL